MFTIIRENFKLTEFNYKIIPYFCMIFEHQDKGNERRQINIITLI